MSDTLDKRQVRPKFSARIAFLARKDAIEAALLPGPSLKSVYERLKLEKVMGYVQFTRYVANYLPHVPQCAPALRRRRSRVDVSVAEPAPTHSGSDPSPAAPAADPGPRQLRTSPSRGFVHNPVPDINKLWE